MRRVVRGGDGGGGGRGFRFAIVPNVARKSKQKFA